ncbi:MAG: hypothetical protein ACUVXJ_13120 [Phycisphaerae bacterium]
MTRAKKFDCVKMKNDIQARLAEQHRGLTDEQIREQVHRQLSTSNSPIARLWREASGEHEKAPPPVVEKKPRRRKRNMAHRTSSNRARTAG